MQKIVGFDIREVDSGFDICLTIDYRDDNIETLECRQTMQFWCDDIRYDVLKYRGMSYENVYMNPQYQAFLQKINRHMAKDECF